MQLHTTYNDQLIGFGNLGHTESVVVWYSETATYDVSHMRLYAICRICDSMRYVVLSRGTTAVLQVSTLRCQFYQYLCPTFALVDLHHFLWQIA